MKDLTNIKEKTCSEWPWIFKIGHNFIRLLLSTSSNKHYNFSTQLKMIKINEKRNWGQIFFSYFISYELLYIYTNNQYIKRTLHCSQRNLILKPSGSNALYTTFMKEILMLEKESSDFRIIFVRLWELTLLFKIVNKCLACPRRKSIHRIVFSLCKGVSQLFFGSYMLFIWITIVYFF